MLALVAAGIAGEVSAFLALADGGSATMFALTATGLAALGSAVALGVIIAVSAIPGRRAVLRRLEEAVGLVEPAHPAGPPGAEGTASRKGL